MPSNARQPIAPFRSSSGLSGVRSTGCTISMKGRPLTLATDGPVLSLAKIVMNCMPLLQRGHRRQHQDRHLIDGADVIAIDQPPALHALCELMHDRCSTAQCPASVIRLTISRCGYSIDAAGGIEPSAADGGIAVDIASVRIAHAIGRVVLHRATSLVKASQPWDRPVSARSSRR